MTSSNVRQRWSAALTALLCLTLGAACADDTTSEASVTTDAPTTTAAAAKVVAPEAVGPYKVGRQVVEMTDGARGRTLTVDVWYPAEPDATGGPSRYSFLPTVFFDSKIALDSPPVAAGGPFPLVVYSHGSGGLRYVASYFTEVLASHGFVVIAPDHTGNTAVDEIGGTSVSDEQNAINRVADAQFVITDMLRRNTADGDPFHGSVDPDRVGISGHSFGGFTALAAPVGYSNALGAVPADPRIKAVVAMAPYSDPIDDAGLTALDVPTLLITGTKDTTTPIEPMTVRSWEHVTGRPLYRVDLIDAGHQSFTDVCAYQQLLPTIPDVPSVLVETVDELAQAGCPSTFLDIDRAHEVTDIFAISFLEANLAGTKGYDHMLTAEGASTISEVKFSVREP